MNSSSLRRIKSLSRRLAEKPEWRMFYLQRFVLEYHAREAIAAAFSKRLPQAPAANDPSQRATALAEQFRKAGVVVLPDLLNQAEVADIRACLSTKPCWGGSIHKYYDLEDLLQTPGIVGLINHPLIVSVAQRVLGCKPTLSEVAAWWLYHDFDPVEGTRDHSFYADRPLEYHRDIDDWMVVRVLIYLTDVASDSGPHTYLQNSNRKNLRLFRSANLGDSSLSPMLKERLDITGKAGTVIMMNPYGLHRAVVPKSSDRLILGYSFSLHPTYQSPSQPVVSMGPIEGCDPYVNRRFVAFNAAR
jgi:hypothetical protein